MKALSGSPYSIRDLGDLEWWCDLIEYEGPLLSLYHVENRRLFIEMWVEKKGVSHRWLLFRTTDEQLRGYFGRRVSLREMLAESRLVLTFLRGVKGRRQVRHVSFQEIAEYLPDEESFFEPRFATADARRLATEVTAEYNIQIAGDWFLDDWSSVPRLYRQIYAFNHALNNLEKKSVLHRVSGGLTRRPFRGGASVVGLLGDMNEAIPPISRLRVEAINYHSPGYICLRADPNITGKVEAVMVVVVDAEKRSAVTATYKAMNKYLDDYGLRKLENSDFNVGLYEDFESVDSDLRGYAKTLMGQLSHEDAVTNFLAASSSLTIVKALSAYVKRLFSLAEYVEEGLITQFGGPRNR